MKWRVGWTLFRPSGRHFLPMSLYLNINEQ
jgi:hypothetical protein